MLGAVVTFSDTVLATREGKMSQPVISIEPANPLAMPPDQLTGFVQELQATLRDYRVDGLSGEAMPRGMRGVTWWEIVNVWVPEGASGWVIGKVLEAGYHWAKDRFKRKNPLGPDRRRNTYGYLAPMVRK
jgi:hypothetical protein